VSFWGGGGGVFVVSGGVGGGVGGGGGGVGVVGCCGGGWVDDAAPPLPNPSPPRFFFCIPPAFGPQPSSIPSALTLASSLVLQSPHPFFPTQISIEVFWDPPFFLMADPLGWSLPFRFRAGIDAQDSTCLVPPFSTLQSSSFPPNFLPLPFPFPKPPTKWFVLLGTFGPLF